MLDSTIAFGGFPGGGSMRRRDFITTLGSVGVTLPFAAVAQQAGRTYRLGALLPYPWPVNAAFLQEFQRYGFIEGQNLTVEWHALGQDPNLLPQYAAELAGARVDVTTTAGEEATRAAQQATKTIPIVALVDDLLASGHVQSLARPDGNITGVSILAVDLDGKRQELLIEAVSGLRRMAALADVYKAAANLDALKEAARAHNVELSIYRVARGEDITAALNSAQASGAAAINILAGALIWANRWDLIANFVGLRVPTMHEFPEIAEEGAFAAYGPRISQVFVEVIPQQIVKLFRGAKVADVPVQQPTKFELVINLKIAKTMGVTVPPALLLRADKLIE